MTQSSKEWGQTQKSGDSSLTTHRVLVPAPKSHAPIKPALITPETSSDLLEESIAPPVQPSTVKNMAISAGHLSALTKERLVASRPIFTPIPDSHQSAVRSKPFLVSVINSAPKIPIVIDSPDVISMAPLDMGRIHLPGAITHLNWTLGTTLEWAVEEDHYLLTQSSSSSSSSNAIDSQGRYLIPVAARRRLGIKSNEQMLVVTSVLPFASVRIYPCKSLVANLLERNEY